MNAENVGARLSASAALTVVSVEPPTLSASVSVAHPGDGSGDSGELITTNLATNLVSSVADAKMKRRPSVVV